MGDFCIKCGKKMSKNERQLKVCGKCSRESDAEIIAAFKERQARTQTIFMGGSPPKGRK